MPAFAPPLVPDSDEAAEWAREELSRSVYSTGPSFWEWLWAKFLELLEKITSLGSGLGPAFVPLIILTLVAAVIILALTLSGPIRRRRAAAGAPGAMWQDDDARSAAQLREAADSAATGGDFTLAVIEQFRATVRALEERGLLETTRGMTAMEVAGTAARVFPQRSEPLHRGARSFNEALYGNQPATHAQYIVLRDLERDLQDAQPARAMEPA
ncbi:MAG TPA: DUF4129 domain-containing protein [Beutenbergiaceae bacterium]|nr:DUF4129 domain-containing protein [Beutenbergiaceae bacterium]